MQNTQIRFGRRPTDQPTLVEELVVFGKRCLYAPAKNALPPHCLNDYQLIFMESGVLEVYLDGRAVSVFPQQILIVRPYEIMRYVSNTLPVGNHYFLQLNAHNLNTLHPTFEKISEKTNYITQTLLVELQHSFINDKNNQIIQGTSHCLELLKQLLQEHQNADKYSQLSAFCSYNALCIQLIRLLEKHQVKGRSDDLSWIQNVSKYVERNLCRNISTSELSALVGISENQLRIKLKQAVAQSPQQFVSQKRVELAKRLLCEETASITDIAYEMGFSSPQYFSLFFKKYTSLTPFEYRSEKRTMLIDANTDIVSDNAAAQRLDAHFS